MILHFSQLGQGPDVIVIHGLFGSSDNLQALARSLSAQFRVTSVDVRNHGRSPRASDMDYPSLANDVLETMDSLGIQHAAVFGHSMGGKIAMQIALLAPTRVRCLVLADISPVQNQDRHTHIFERLCAIDTGALQNRQQADAQLAIAIEDAGTRAFLLKSLQRNLEGKFDWQFNVKVLAAQYHQILAAPTLHAPFIGPVLFIKGGNSDYIQASQQPQVLQYFPNAKLKIIAGTGHWLHAEKPAIFNKICLDFLIAETNGI